MKFINIGRHWITERELRNRLVDKIPKAQFASIIKKIEKDLDKEHPVKVPLLKTPLYKKSKRETK
jgi:hypothetical protein